MQSLKLSGRYEIVNVNNRKEAHGEEKILAVDVKMTGFASVRELVPLLGVESEAEALGTLWDSETADITLLNIETIKPIAVDFESMTGKVGSVKYTEAKAHKFSIAPSSGGGTLTWTLSVPHPEKSKVGELAQLIGETHKVELMPMQVDTDDIEDQAKHAEAQTEAEAERLRQQQ